MNKFAPIALFVYNRPAHTQQVIQYLQRNLWANESELFIFSDGAKNETDKSKVDQVRFIIHSVKGFKKIIIQEQENNRGLSGSIIYGVTQLIEKYGKVIVLEDDLLPSPYFLKFMNEALDLYQNEEDVISIHGYVYPISDKLPKTFFIKGADCWGWATWKRGWNLFNPNSLKLINELEERKLTKEFNFNNSYPYFKMLKHQAEGKNDSWAVRWYASAFLKNKLTLYPNRSLIFYNGSDGSGTNCGISDEFVVELSKTPIALEKIDIKENIKARKAFVYYFRYTLLNRKIKSWLKKFFRKK